MTGESTTADDRPPDDRPPPERHPPTTPPPEAKPMRRLVEGRVEGRDRNEEGRPENARPRDRFGRPLPYGAVDELADRDEPEDVVSSVAEALPWAQRLFDDGRFFEAHEFLEYVWKSPEVDDADRDYWKGVTQIAVGFAHTQRGNAQGARALLTRAVGFVRTRPSPYGGVDGDALVAGAEDVLRQVDARGPSPDLDFPPFPLINSGGAA